MTAAPLHFYDQRLLLDPAGAVFWPARNLLVVADLHFEKATSLAARGALLPPFDTRATLERLVRLVRLYRPATVVALGDSFHDRDGCARLGADERARLEALGGQAALIWISGNHDPGPNSLPGTVLPEWREQNFVFRHQAEPRLAAGEVELSGHFHPKASIESRAKRISRPCFATDAARLMLPAFGAYAGGLDVRDPAIARLFPRGLRVFLLGQGRLFSFNLAQLGRVAVPGMTAAIAWFRNDLRLADNPVLHAALAAAERVLPVFILDESMGGAARWWLHHSLQALAADLRKRGATLLLRRGDPAEIIPELAAAAKASSVHVGLAFEPAMRRAEDAVEAALRAPGVTLTRHLSAMLFHPQAIRTKSGGPFNVFTPFSRACFERGVPEETLPAPRQIKGVAGLHGDKLEDWALLPTRPDWAGGLREEWRPGEAGAAARLKTFLAGAVAGYDKGRDLPGTAGTSMLSPHSHHGEISPRALWHAVAATGHGKGPQTFLKELLWREFSISLLWHHPDLPDQPIRPEFKKFPWVKDKKGLRAWQRGRTGVPIVDAGMRQLWQTGWMHNRVRMIVASYLTKHQLISWREGAAWFMDTLCEADLAANAANWQWVAGCGADAAPYFRIFNPVLQGWKFDPAGDYVRRYVPELAALPDKVIHNPWDADAETLTNARVALGKTYPRPLISLAEGRDRALAAYQKIKGG